MGKPTDYFRALNYTLANEDTRIEQQLLEKNHRHIVAIGGSGSRVLPLLRKETQRIEILDVSKEQLFLAELRIKSMQKLRYEEFLFLLGYSKKLASTTSFLSSADKVRFELLKSINLSPAANSFFSDKRLNWLSEGIILKGRWESYFRKLGQTFRLISGVDFTPLFETNDLEEQREFFQKNWPKKRLDLFIRTLCHPYLINRFLYRGRFAKAKNQDQTFHKFILALLENLFTKSLARENFFLQLLFLGELLYSEGFPLEATEESFLESKKFQGEVVYRNQDLMSFCRENSNTPRDFYSLSDVSTYLSEVELKELESLILNSSNKSFFVLRSFLSHPHWQKTNLMNRDKCLWAHQTEQTGLYHFHIWNRNSFSKNKIDLVPCLDLQSEKTCDRMNREAESFTRSEVI